MGKMKDTAAAFILLISVEKGPQRRGLDSQAALTRRRMQISDAETGALHSERSLHIVRGTVSPHEQCTLENRLAAVESFEISQQQQG